ncbi:aldo/keto reductase [Cryobacterium sp. PH31-O1]|uniref:aldo/keto reductase n=1 Tax=Cryobacterium sp. PH31-O1 TaxID=3046306 RepID=UPI0024B98DBC|nr:aldo/keto reductase [Cryobacterium sp. PH31-O1]MDJ0339883.1 aldo/keto reductase [Cryobacterium sp. PH31-O1]
MTLPPARLIYGCMGLGGDWTPGQVTTAAIDQAAAAIEAALSIGVSVFDHADIYRFGKAETAFGEVLKRTPGLRERIEIQTKCGIRLDADHAPYDLSTIVARVDDSLARLGVDYVDTLLLHRPDPLLEPADMAAAVADLLAAGKIRALGVSNMSGEQIAFLQRETPLPIVVNQLEMSLHRHDWVDSTVLVNHPDAAGNTFPHGTLEYCASNGVRLQAWGALAQGRYSGAPAPTRTAADEAASALVHALAEMKNTTREAIVLGWLMRHPAHIDPVLGSSDPARIRACADAVNQAAAMTRDEWFALYLAARGRPLP